MRFSENSEANASEFLESLEDMFPWYYRHSDVCNGFNLYHITIREMIKMGFSCVQGHVFNTKSSHCGIKQHLNPSCLYEKRLNRWKELSSK